MYARGVGWVWDEIEFAAGGWVRWRPGPARLLRLHALPGRPVPATRPLVVEVRIARAPSGRVVPLEVRVTAPGAEDGVRARDLAKVPLTRLLALLNSWLLQADVERALAEPGPAAPPRDYWPASSDPGDEATPLVTWDAGDDAEEVPMVTWEAGEGEPPDATRPRRRTAGREAYRVPRPQTLGTKGDKGDAFYRRVARVYTRAALRERAPAEAIARANRVPVTTIHRWVREARRRKFLPPGRPGVVG